jgi:VanZ family protein
VLNKIFLYPALIWTGILTFFCLVESGELSKFPKVSDKLGHCTFHFILTTLWFFYFYFNKANNSLKKALLYAFSFSLIFGILIELAQAIFTTTRKADVLDVLANSIGGLIAVIAILASMNLKTRMLQNK